MDNIKKKNLRSTKMQIKLLEKYMANNKTIAYNTEPLSGPLEAHRRAKEWGAIRVLLRKYGPDKSVEKWKQTWKDLKRKRKKEKSEVISINAESHTKEKVEKKCSTVNNSDTIDETSMEYVDPLESISEVGASVKEERPISPVEIELPSTDVDLDIPCSSPMQVILTNTAFTSTSTSTQTSSKPFGPTDYSNPCMYRKPPSICAHNSDTINPPSVCVHENWSTPTSCSYAQSCHQKIHLDAVPGTNNLQNQQNALLQRLCNLLEEQNSNLRIRNRIERNKMRFQFCRRF